MHDPKDSKYPTAAVTVLLCLHNPDREVGHRGACCMEAKLSGYSLPHSEIMVEEISS